MFEFYKCICLIELIGLYEGQIRYTKAIYILKHKKALPSFVFRIRFLHVGFGPPGIHICVWCHVGIEVFLFPTGIHFTPDLSKSMFLLSIGKATLSHEPAPLP